MTALVSVATARRILGSLSDDMSDDQVQQLIYDLHLLAREQVLYNGSKEENVDEEPEELK